MINIQKTINALNEGESYLDQFTADPNNQGTEMCNFLEITSQHIRELKSDLQQEILIYKEKWRGF